ncbi:SETMR methyltransferase, partial [Acromyrmex heyeri]
MKWIKSYFILKMEINKEKIRYILQYYYDKGKNTAQACEKICAIYGEDTQNITRQKLRELGWEVLMHPPYSGLTALSDYHLFRSLQNSLNGVKLASKEACENHS